MKKAALLLVIALLLTTSAFAHPGRTDANGGHYDRATGEYHFHHGYPAHQHTGGACPYDFDDQTGLASGNGGGGGDNGSGTPHSAVSEAAGDADPLPLWGSLFLLLLALLSLWVILLQIVTAVMWCVESAKERKKRREGYMKLYAGKSISALAGVPDWCAFDESGYPHCKSAAGAAEDPFTVYVTKSGRSYHTALCRHAKKAAAVNLCQARDWGLAVCAVCHPMEALPPWAVKYRSIKAIRDKYRIPMEK